MMALGEGFIDTIQCIKQYGHQGVSVVVRGRDGRGICHQYLRRDVDRV